MTRAEVRAAIVNLDPAQKKVHLPTWFDEVRWHRIDYLGWRDLRAPMRVYLVADVDDEAFGVILRQNPNQTALGSRAVMCDCAGSLGGSTRFHSSPRHARPGTSVSG
ncbi:hypothetical protein J2X34_000896 [Rhodococcus sp. BE178]